MQRPCHFLVNTLQRPHLSQRRPALSAVYEAVPVLARCFSSLIYNLCTRTYTCTLILPQPCQHLGCPWSNRHFLGAFALSFPSAWNALLPYLSWLLPPLLCSDVLFHRAYPTPTALFKTAAHLVVTKASSPVKFFFFLSMVLIKLLCNFHGYFAYDSSLLLPIRRPALLWQGILSLLFTGEVRDTRIVLGTW